MRNSKRTRKKKLTWVLQLYVANTTPRSLLAIANLQSLCERYLGNAYEIRVVDILKDPDLAIRDDVLATPTLVRVEPAPQKKMIGSLSNMQAVLRGLDLGRGSEPADSRPTPPVAFSPKDLHSVSSKGGNSNDIEPETEC